MVETKDFSRDALNFGIAMEARIPMITTTMRSSISVNPLSCSCSFLHLHQIRTGGERAWPGRPEPRSQQPKAIQCLRSLRDPPYGRHASSPAAVGVAGAPDGALAAP